MKFCIRKFKKKKETLRKFNFHYNLTIMAGALHEELKFDDNDWYFT